MLRKVVDPDAPRKLGALEKPVPITEELAIFLGISTGEMFSRQFITQSINKYVKDNDLQNPENRRYILLESEAGLKLKALLRDPDQPLTFFNIQRYLKVHYPKVETEGTEGTEGTETKAKTPREIKGKSVDASEATLSTDVVPDAGTVDETSTSEAPKKSSSQSCEEIGLSNKYDLNYLVQNKYDLNYLVQNYYKKVNL